MTIRGGRPRDAFVKWVGSYGPTNPFTYEGRTHTKQESIRKEPKLAFWQSCMACTPHSTPENWPSWDDANLRLGHTSDTLAAQCRPRSPHTDVRPSSSLPTLIYSSAALSQSPFSPHRCTRLLHWIRRRPGFPPSGAWRAVVGGVSAQWCEW